MPRVSAATLAALEVKDLKEQLVALEKKLKDAESMRKYHDGRADQANKELEGIHEILDVMTGTLARDKADGYSKHTAGVRLASFLASRATN